MYKVGDMKLYTFDEILDEQVGKIGTARRDDFESKVAEAVESYKLGEAIKAERVRQNITQEELGERIGVKKSQISRIEKGSSSITISTLSRVLKALGVSTASIEMGEAGKIALW